MRLALCLFCSGAAALVLEVAWFRRLAQVSGATSVALAGVLAAVIGGMALGSLLVGRWADRVQRPTRLYAFLEIGVTLCALGSPWWIDWGAPVYVALADAPLARFGFSVLHLAPAAILMGGTLPALAAALDIAPERRGRALGALYAANTLGAVVGTLAAGFFLLPTVGLNGSMRWAAVGSGVAALVAWWAPLSRAGATTDAHGAPSSDARRAIALFAISGFLGMASEVGFTRGLVLVFGSSTYAFTTALAVFLFGIGVGGALGARLATPSRNAMRWLAGIVGLTAGLFAVAGMALYWLPRWYLEIYVGQGGIAAASAGTKFALSAVVLLPGALGLGAAFPFAARIAAAAQPGAGTGRLYGANTIASILGSTIAVYILVPTWGPHLAIAIPAVVVAALALALVPSRFGVACVILAGVGALPPSDVARERLAMGVYYAPGRYVAADGSIDDVAWNDGVDLPFTEYGREATVSLFRWYGTLSLLVDGKAVASQQSVQDVQHLELLGHLPMALHPRPERVLVVGLGLGTTYRAVLSHKPPELVVVEIEEAVANAIAALGVKPRNLVINDARLYLKANDEKFDVITSDPIHPWVRGGGDLYTREYFELCRARLRDDGVMCHWLPLYQMGLADVRAVARTFASVFHTDVYFAGTDLVLVGRRAANQPARDGVVLGEAVSRLRVAGHDATVRASANAALLTEDRLILEYSAPHHLESQELGSILRWVQTLWASPATPYGAILEAQIAQCDQDGAKVSAAIERALQQAPQHQFARRFAGEVYLQAAGSVQSEGFLKAARRYLGDDPRLLGVEADLRAKQGRRAEAAALYRRLLATQPDNVYVKRRLAHVTEE